jgi:hypothetical protein
VQQHARMAHGAQKNQASWVKGAALSPGDIPCARNSRLMRVGIAIRFARRASQKLAGLRPNAKNAASKRLDSTAAAGVSTTRSSGPSESFRISETCGFPSSICAQEGVVTTTVRTSGKCLRKARNNGVSQSVSPRWNRPWWISTLLTRPGLAAPVASHWGEAASAAT